VIVVGAAAEPVGTIAPSVLYGAGPPIDGLDANPYREAPQLRKNSAADNNKAHQSARGSTKESGSGTFN